MPSLTEWRVPPANQPRASDYGFDLDRALDAVVFMIYSLNGERCTSSSRLLVQKSIEEEFTERLVERVRKLKVGHPLDPSTELGPLIHPKHVEKVLGYFGVARGEGAAIPVGGGAAAQGGNYVQPTVLAGAHNKMRVAQEEIFGPVLTVIPFTDEKEIGNDPTFASSWPPSRSPAVTRAKPQSFRVAVLLKPPAVAKAVLA